jgi:hypothetical protein
MLSSESLRSKECNGALSPRAAFRDVFEITDSLVCPKLLSLRFRPEHDAPPLKTDHGRGGRRQRGRRLSGGSGRPLSFAALGGRK